MALPITPTPKLSGKAADRFLAMIEKGLKNPYGPVPTPGLERARRRIIEDIDKRRV